MPLDAPIMPGELLDISEPEREMLGKHLVDVTMDLEADNADLIDNIEVWWDWYEAKPLTEKRSDPWEGASNVVIPLIQYHSDALKSRLQNTIFAVDDLWKYRTRAHNSNNNFREVARETTDFLNWAGNDNDFDIYTPSTQWFDEMVPIGGSILQLGWAARQRVIFIPGEGGKPVPTSVTLGRGPHFQQVPRENILWRSSGLINDSELIVKQALKTRSDMATMSQFTDFYPDALERAFNIDSDGGYTSNVRRTKRSNEGESAFHNEEQFDIREAYIEWPVLRGLKFEDPRLADSSTPRIPLVVTFNRDTGEVLRAIAKPYFTRGWGFYEGQFRTAGKRKNPGGTAKRLRHMQAATTTMLNQAIDSVTLANSVNFITTNARLLTQRFVPGRPTLVDDMGSIDSVSMSKLVAPDIALINTCFAIAERLTGISDPALGREIRMGGHPSPATSTAIMLNESKEMLRTTVKQLRHQYGRIAEDTATLYQQYEAFNSGKIERAIGEEDASLAKQWLFPKGPIAGRIEFDLRAASETMNLDQDRQNAVFTMQVTASYHSQVLQALNIAAQPQTPPPVKEAAIKSIEALTVSFERVLETAQIDDMRQFVYDIKESQFNAGTINSIGTQVAGQLRDVDGARGGRPLPPTAAGPNGVPVGANETVTSSGF